MTFHLPEKMPEAITADAWIAELLKEVQLVDPQMITPPFKLKEGVETALGTLTDPTLRKMYVLSTTYHKEAEHIQIDIRHTQEDSEEALLLQKAAMKASLKSTILNGIFWAVIRDTFPIEPYMDLGIRQGWIITSAEHRSTGGSIKELLLGGGGE